MPRLKLSLLLLTFLSLPTLASAQTTVNLTVQDTGSVLWNGPWSVVLRPPPGFPPGTTMTIVSGGGSTASQSGTLVSGTASVSLPSNANMVPVGSLWYFTVCFGTSGNCFTQLVNVGTSSPQTVTITPPAPGAPPSSGGGSSVSPNSPLPAATSGPGPVFNVKNYGAFGDTRSSVNCTQSSFTMTCSDITFVAGDVGKRVSCNNTGFSNTLPVTTITGFTSAHVVTVGLSNNNPSPGGCIIGTPDDTTVAAAQTAALAQMVNIVTSGNLTANTAAPVLYFPAGNYNLFNTGLNVVGPGTIGSFTIKGDGLDASKIYWHALSTNAQNAAMACNNVSHFYVEGLTLDGADGTSFGNAVNASCTTHVKSVRVQRFNGIGWFSPQQLFANDIQLVANKNTNLLIQGGGEVYESLVSNSFSGNNLLIQNVTGLPFGPGFRWNDGLIDEGGIVNASVQVTNSADVYFSGAAIFTGMKVDANSFVHINSSNLGPFSSDNTLTPLTISAGGIVQSSDTRYASTGAGNCISNSGTFNDNGGNSCESMFLIASGTSTGTTAVLTLTPALTNVNVTCSTGDALIVTGASIAGYNGYFQAGATSGITATSATTLTYTTIGSNLGALSGGGTASCRNLQTYTGTLPKALLNNPIPNTCYVTITPIVNATTYQMCNWGSGSATNIIRITASSQNVTTCATPPIITISNGTVSQTLTLTSGKQFWDSFNSIDASTGVGTTIFKPSISLTGTDRITVKYDAGALSACATPPTQLSVSYTIAPILSN